MKFSLVFLSALAATAFASPAIPRDEGFELASDYDNFEERSVADVFKREADEGFYLAPDTDSGAPKVRGFHLVDRADHSRSNFNFTGKHANALENLLDGLTAIPEAALAKGDEAVNDWLIENGYRPKGAKLPPKNAARDMGDAPNLLVRGWWEVTKCIGAILMVIGSTAIPIAKIGRIRAYIKALGGTREAVELLLKASTWEERIRIGGTSLALLGSEILGISTIMNNC
jgi:hypothetical protein